MSEPFIGEIRLCSFSFPPAGWVMCNGQFLPISQNAALFSLLGTTYGGNGTTNFALPDLRGRIPLHFGAGVGLGQQGGELAHTLTANETAHTHPHNSPNASNDFATASSASSHFVATPVFGTTAAKAFSAVANTSMAAGSLDFVGGSQAHNNMMPYLTINFVIALRGLFPPHS